MAQLGVIFVQYDQERYGNAFSLLLKVLQQFKKETVVTVKVDNKHEDQPLQVAHRSVIEVGGDNTLFEFSGWMKGWQVLQTHQGDCDCYLFVTDAFLAYGDNYQDLVADLLPFLLKQSAVAGLVDLPPTNLQSLKLLNWELDSWIRSSFFFIPHPVLTRMQSLITIDEVDRFCEVEFHHRAFKPDAPLSLHYQIYLEQWLTRDWHSAFPLSPDTWEFFRNKIRSILNEHALTGRWQEMAIPIYDLHFLKNYSRQQGLTLLDIPPQSLERYCFHLTRQKEYYRLSFPARVIHKIKRLFLTS